MSPILSQFVYGDVEGTRWQMTGGSVKDFIKLKVNNVNCSPLIHQSIHFITEGYQIGQSWFFPSEIHIFTMLKKAMT